MFATTGAKTVRNIVLNPARLAGALLHAEESTNAFVALGGPGPHNKRRVKPRHVTPTRVETQVYDAESFEDIWNNELCKGIFFVESSASPPPASRIDLEFVSESARLSLCGRVVTVIEAGVGTQNGLVPGFAVEFENFTEERRAALRQLACLNRQGDAEQAERVDVDEAFDRARQFLEATDRGALYEAAQTTRTAEPSTIADSLDRLDRFFCAALPWAPPPRAARIQAARTVLGRVRRILLRKTSRLDYDFRIGEYRLETRMRAAAEGRGPGFETLRATWAVHFPEHMDEARQLTASALRAAHRQDLRLAIRLGERALEADPFFVELKEKVEKWRHAVEQASED